jgi:hypothetical protein
MRRSRGIWLVCWACALAACARAEPPHRQQPPAPREPVVVALSPQELLARVQREQLEHDFPLHGLVTGVQLKVRRQPDSDGTTLGWLREGSRVRLAAEALQTPDCSRGFYRLAPSGYVCPNEGIQISDQPPAPTNNVVPPQRDAALPYEYFFVQQPATAEYHRLPSPDEQRSVRDFASRYLELRGSGRADAEKNAQKLLAGELKNEPAKPEIVRRFIERGYFIAGAGMRARADQQFVRTVRGSFVQLSDLQPRRGSLFKGVALDAAHTLPIAWAVRAAQSFIPKLDDAGTHLLNDAGSRSYERLARVPWLKRERIGDQLYHRLDDGHYLRTWYLAVAEAIAPPKGVKPDEPWVHVNLEQQTLVAYRGDTPIYATLVSTGIEGHETQPGLFEIRSKHVTTSMSDLDPETSPELRYSIDDVPWTEYFSGSFALHGAFWHAGFGLRHSHGCVNLSPSDAHWLFEHTWPPVADGWHGVTTDGTGLQGSKVLITEH